MQVMIKENVDPPESPVNGLRSSDLGGNSNSLVASLSEPSDQGKLYSLDDSESFYDKLYGLYESSGLNLVLNAREALLNLHVFYKEVTERGGYNQVTKDKRWEEVSMAMKLEGIKVKFPQQLQKVYALFLYQFEQIYFYRAPEKSASNQVFLVEDSSATKRKSSAATPHLFVDQNYDVDSPPELKKSKEASHSPFFFSGDFIDPKLSPSTPAKPKETVKGQKSDRPKRTRTAYQIFLKRECERLRNTVGEKLVGQSFRVMADAAWRHLSESDRQPYVEESNKAKEMYLQEMNALEDRNDAEDSKPENEYSVGPPELGKPPQEPDQTAAVDVSAKSVPQNSQNG